MKFWEGNKVTGEFEMSEREVARTFVTHMRRARRRLASAADYTRAPDQEQIDKLDNWPLERTLRDWMTRTDGLNASWEDEASFGEILDLVTHCRCDQPVKITSGIMTREHFRVDHRERTA